MFSYERANGYNYEAVARSSCCGGSKQPVVVHYIEHCPPDVGAAFIWLKKQEILSVGVMCRTLSTVLGKYIISTTAR